MTEATVLPGLLRNHRTPKDRYGMLLVEQGRLQFQWEDDQAILDADPQHPFIIFPERFHRVLLAGPVAFRVEFYEPDGPEGEQTPLLPIEPRRPKSS